MTQNYDYQTNMNKEKIETLSNQLEAVKGEHSWFTNKMDHLEKKVEQVADALNSLVIEIRVLQKELSYSIKHAQQLEDEVKSFKKAVKVKFEEQDNKLAVLDKFQVRVVAYATAGSFILGLIKDQLI